MNWEIIFQAISAIGVIFAILMSISAKISSSKTKQNTELTKTQEETNNKIDQLDNKLTRHILDDKEIQTELRGTSKECSNGISDLKDLAKSQASKLDSLINHLLEKR